MALVKCRECGVQVSTTAVACPGCGAKVKKPISRLTLFFVGVALIFGAKAAFEEANTAPRPAAAVKSAEQLAAEQAKEALFQKVVLGAKLLKKGMKNPASFQLVSAAVMSDGSICYEYRGTNSFNATVLERYVVSSKGGSKDGGAWNKYCGGKSGEDFTHAKHAL